MSNEENPTVDFPVEVETVEIAESALSDAKAALEEKEEKINAVESAKAELADKADAFEQVAAAHGFNADSEDFEVSDVVDRHTTDLRTEVAHLEAALAKYETDSDNLDARASELCGKSPQYLEERAGKLAREQLEAQAEQDNRTKGVVADAEASRQVGNSTGVGGMSESEQVEEMADGVLDFEEVAKAKQRNQSPSQFIKTEYEVEASDYGSEVALQEAVRSVRKNGGEN